MKTNLLIASLVLFLNIVLINGQDCCTDNKITIQGFGKNKIKPTIAVLYATIKTEDSNITNALTKLDTILDNITIGIQLNGLSHNDMRTISFNVYPKYDTTIEQKSLIGFIVYLSLTISIRGIQEDSQKIAKIINSLARQGVISINGITYDTQDPYAGKVQARNNAYQDAVKKANQYVKLTGRKLGKAIIFNQTTSSYSPLYNTTQPINKIGLPNNKNISSTTSTDDTSNLNMKFPDIPIGTILINSVVFISWNLI